MDIQAEIEKIEKEIRETPYHKGTEHHIGKLRAKIAKLKDELVQNKTAGKGSPVAGEGFSVKHQGDSTVVLVGYPSVGKSTLLNLLTSAHSRVAAYAFTTLTVIPGMLDYKGAKIQILDVPGLVTGAALGKGKGKEVLAVARSANLLLIIVDVQDPQTEIQIKKELFEAGVRLDRQKPKVVIKKRDRGNIVVISKVKQDFSDLSVGEVAREYRLTNAEITLKEKLTLDELIDVFSANRVYIPSLTVFNKADTLGGRREIENGILISAQKGEGIATLKEAIWEKLGFIRVYLLRIGQKEPDFESPVVARKGETLKDLAEKIGQDFNLSVGKAKISGVGAKFPGQEVSLSTPLQEGMIVTFLR